MNSDAVLVGWLEVLGAVLKFCSCWLRGTMCSRLVFLVLAVSRRLGWTLRLELGAGSEAYWDQHSQALLPGRAGLLHPKQYLGRSP